MNFDMVQIKCKNIDGHYYFNNAIYSFIHKTFVK